MLPEQRNIDSLGQNGTHYPVMRLTQEAYDALHTFAMEQPDRYLNPETDFHDILVDMGINNYALDTGIFTDAPISLKPATGGAPNSADRQALSFYESFHGMNPERATDKLIWAWMTHFRLHSYTLKRWRRQENTNLTEYIRAHWFVDNQGAALWNSNTGSRTWWIAHTAVKAAQASGGAFTATAALEHFATFAVHYHILIRSTILRSPVVLAEFVRALLNEATGIKAERGGLELFRRLNLAAGVRMLDMLSRQELRKFIVEQVDEVMSNTDSVRDRKMIRNRLPAIRSLSLGAGVQSTVLALMADRGEYGLTPPDVAVFADTGWEPPSVYEHLEWLQSQLSFEVVRVSAGNIRENILKGVNPDGRDYLTIPAFVINPDGSKAAAARQCTSQYKIEPIHRYLRDRMGIPYGRRAPKDVYAEIWMGISSDEILRQKPSREEWVTNRFPLIELGFSRAQLLSWFQEHFPNRYLPRSSCVGCPYHTNAEWKWLQNNEPEAFADAVYIDWSLRNDPKVKNAITKKGQAFLHRSRVPLAEVDFSDTRDYDSVMLDECEGICGI